MKSQKTFRSPYQKDTIIQKNIQNLYENRKKSKNQCFEKDNVSKMKNTKGVSCNKWEKSRIMALFAKGAPKTKRKQKTEKIRRLEQ